MHPIAIILHKTVVRKFYERNTGFFLFIFYFMFGLVESTQIVNYHLSLIYGLLQSAEFLGIICVVWVFYTFKCFFFIAGFVSAQENSFLSQQLNTLPYSKKIGWLFYIFTLVALPVIIYVSLIIGVAGSQRFYATAAFIILFHIILLVAASVIMERNLSSLTPSMFRWPSIRIGFPLPLPFPFHYLGAVLHNHKLILIVSKGFSVFAIIGFMNIPLDHYEYRTAMMGLLFGVAAHAVIVFEFRQLEDQSMTFMRQLPLTMITRFFYLVIVYALLLLPEIIMILVNHISIPDTLLIYLGGIACLLFSHCSLYKKLDMDKHIQFILILFLVGFSLTLFKMVLPTAIIVLFLAYFRFQKNYYTYEAPANLSVG